jgi:hypothetical protein
MKKAACLLGLFLMSLLLAQAKGGEKSQFEDVIKQVLDTMDSLKSTLATIQDEDTAKSARPVLHKTVEKWQLIKKKAENLPPPSKEEKDRLAKQYRTKLEDAQKKLFGEVGRVSAIPGGRDALLEISNVLDKKAK